MFTLVCCGYVVTTMSLISGNSLLIWSTVWEASKKHVNMVELPCHRFELQWTYAQENNTFFSVNVKILAYKIKFLFLLIKSFLFLCLRAALCRQCWCLDNGLCLLVLDKRAALIKLSTETWRFGPNQYEPYGEYYWLTGFQCVVVLDSCSLFSDDY